MRSVRGLAAMGIALVIAQRLHDEAATRHVETEKRRLSMDALDLRWGEADPYYHELSAHPHALPLSCDILSESQVAAALDATLQRFGAPWGTNSRRSS